MTWIQPRLVLLVKGGTHHLFCGFSLQNCQAFVLDSYILSLPVGAFLELWLQFWIFFAHNIRSSVGLLFDFDWSSSYRRACIMWKNIGPRSYCDCSWKVVIVYLMKLQIIVISLLLSYSWSYACYTKKIIRQLFKKYVVIITYWIGFLLSCQRNQFFFSKRFESTKLQLDS